MELNKIAVPVADANDSTQTIREGKVIAINEDKYVTVFINHEVVLTEDGDSIIATPLRVEAPLTRGKLINRAEMDAYGLQDAMEVASFGTSLSRKARLNPEDAEVIEHDAFIADIKESLNAIGII